MDSQRDEHRVHLIVYHLIWCPKRRKPVLTGKIARDCQALIEQKCAEHGWVVVQLAIQPDHVHLFVRVWPTTSAAEVIKECEGLTSHELRTRYPVSHVQGVRLNHTIFAWKERPTIVADCIPL